MPTIKDIAKAAGVSHGTVSNVLNKRGCVSYEKIRLVEETARAMGYAIDEKASTLRRGKAKLIAVLLPALAEAAYADLYTGILRCAEPTGYSVRLFLTDDLPYLERRAISEVLALKPSGVLSVSCLCDAQEYAEFETRGTPVIFLERTVPNTSAPSFIFDMRAAAQTLHHMFDRRKLSGQNISIVCGDPSLPDQQTFADTLKEKFAQKKVDVFFSARAQKPSAAGALTGRKPFPSAVFCTTEEMAALIRSAFSYGSSQIPEIFALVPLRTAYCRDYHSLALNYRLLGHEAASALLGNIERGETLSSRFFSPSRQSVPHAAPAVLVKKPLRFLAAKSSALDALQCLLPRFEQQTKIPVELHAGTMQEVYSALTAPDADRWDVIRLDTTRLPYLAHSILEPLEKLDAHSAEVFGTMFDGIEREFSLVENQIYAFPFDISVQMLFYQKSLFENIGQIRAYYEQCGRELHVPETYAEFDSISRFFSRAHRADSPVPYGSTLALSRPLSLAAEFLPRLLAAGELSYTPSGCLNLLTPQALQAIEEHMAFARYVNPKASGSWDEIAQDFIKDHTATTIMFTHHAARFVHHQGRDTSMEIGFGSIPGKKPLLGGGSLGIGKKCLQPEEAYQFIRWAVSEDIAPELVMLGGASACKCVYEHREILDVYPWLTELENNVRLGVRRGILPQANGAPALFDVEAILSAHLLAAFNGEETPAQALEEAQKALDSLSSRIHV